MRQRVGQWEWGRHPGTRLARLARVARLIQRARAAAQAPLLFALLPLCAGLLLASAPQATAVARAAGGSSVAIVYPVPASGSSTGPVGTNVTIQAAGLTAGDKYVLGYALQGSGCAAGFQGITSTPFDVNADGSYSTTFTWPATAKDVGASYVVCMQDARHTGTPPPPVQSDQSFIVAGTAAPAITVKHAPRPAPQPGQPTPPPVPQSDARYYADEQVIVSGSGFSTTGRDIAVYLTRQAIKAKSDLTNPLTLTAGSFSPDANGAFTATVQLTGDADPGTYYLYAVSADGGDSAPPSLVAYKKISIVPKPTPIPTATAKPAPTATPGPGGNTGGIQHVKSALGLGALSIILFVVGVILLASAANTPRMDG